MAALLQFLAVVLVRLLESFLQGKFATRVEEVTERREQATQRLPGPVRDPIPDFVPTAPNPPRPEMPDVWASWVPATPGDAKP